MSDIAGDKILNSHPEGVWSNFYFLPDVTTAAVSFLPRRQVSSLIEWRPVLVYFPGKITGLHCKTEDSKTSLSDFSSLKMTAITEIL